MLRQPFNDTQNKLWCGPAAISSLTGAPVSKINKMVNRYRNERGYGCGRKTTVRGMFNYELLMIMRRLGYRPHPRRFPTYIKEEIVGKNLENFIRDCGHMGPFIVNVTGHYVAICSGFIVDNQIVVPVVFSEYTKYNSKRVRNFWYYGK